MALKEDRIGQTWLVPRRVTDFIPGNHICYFIANLVEELDFREIDQNIGTRVVKQRIHVECYYE